MNDAVAATRDYRAAADTLSDQVEAMLARHVRPAAPKESDDRGGGAHPDVADAQHSLQRDMRSAGVCFKTEEHAAITNFEAAQFAWEQAGHEYDHALSIAETVLLEVAVPGALPDYAADTGAAAAALASAAGALLSAYAGFTAAITAAKAKQVLAEATAHQNNPQSIDALKD